MANYKIEGNTVVANIAKLTPKEIAIVNNYRALGFELKEAEKPKGKTVDEMRAELAVSPEALKEFDKIYHTKAKKGEKAPFFIACKFYNDWKKEQKAK